MADSDSDDDDILLTKSYFKRPSRQETKKRVQNEAFLDELVKDSERQMDSIARIAQIKRENGGDVELDDELIQRTQEITRSVREDGPTSTMSRRQENEDIMAGLVADDKAHSREYRIKRQRAMDTDLSSALGLRSIIVFDASRCATDIKLYQSKNEATEDLLNVFGSSETLDSCVELIRGAASNGILAELLASQRFKGELDNLSPKHGEKLSAWLYNVVISSSCCAGWLEDLAPKTLLLLRDHNKLCGEWTLDELLNSLMCWVDLKSNKKRPVKSSELQDPQETTPPSKNIQGLKSCLFLWGKIIPNYSASSSIISDTAAANCIVALIRLGLDIAVASNERAGELLSHLQIVVVALIDLVAKQHADSPKDLALWMQKTASATMEGLGDLGPGTEGSEDEDDEEAWLCYAGAVRVIPKESVGAFHNTAIQRFKTELALRAAEALLPKTQSIESKVAVVLDEMGNGPLATLASKSTCWLAITAAYAGLIEIDIQGDNITKDAPRCLSTVQCLFMAYEGGMSLLEDNDPGAAGSGAEYGSMEQAKAFLDFVGPFDTLCSQLSRRFTNLATNAHFRHADYVLMCFHHYNFHMKKKVSYRAGNHDGSGEVKQAKVSSFFAAKGPKTASPIGG